MPKHYSSSCGVFRILQGIKSAKYNLKIPDRAPNLYYKAIEYSGYKWVYIIETSKPKHYSSSFRGIWSHLESKLIKNGPKLPIINLNLLNTHSGTV